MNELVCLLEEPSAQDLLEGLLPRILPDAWTFRLIPFEGKQDLEKRMTRFLKAWRTPGAKFVVLRDQDAADCRSVATSLRQRCADAGRPDALVRVACRELEAWILGDLDSFAEEFSCTQARGKGDKAKYRDPDMLASPVTELRRFVPEYQKRDGARRMGRRISLTDNRSASFGIFCKGIRRVTG